MASGNVHQRGLIIGSANGLLIHSSTISMPREDINADCLAFHDITLTYLYTIMPCFIDPEIARILKKELMIFSLFCLKSTDCGYSLKDKIRKITYTPASPNFLYIKWGLPGKSSHGLVIQMAVFI